MHQPQARTTGIIEREIDGELLVYDLKAHRAHWLNAAAAAVWHHCDGTHELADLAGVAQGEESASLALAQLSEAGLLMVDTGAVLSPERRRLLKRLAMAASVPLVLSISSPAAVQAQSAPCINEDDCDLSQNCGLPCYTGSTVSCNQTKVCNPAETSPNKCVNAPVSCGAG